MITFHLDRENNRHIHHQSASVRDERTMYMYRNVHVYERINAYVHKCPTSGTPVVMFSNQIKSYQNVRVCYRI